MYLDLLCSAGAFETDVFAPSEINVLFFNSSAMGSHGRAGSHATGMASQQTILIHVQGNDLWQYKTDETKQCFSFEKSFMFIKQVLTFCTRVFATQHCMQSWLYYITTLLYTEVTQCLHLNVPSSVIKALNILSNQLSNICTNFSAFFIFAGQTMT